jgi:hypothetical protein
MSKTDTYTVSVTKVPTRMVVTTSPPSSVIAGNRFDFAGYLEDVNGNRLANKLVYLVIDGTETQSMYTSSTGTWGFAVEISAVGDHTLYVVFKGDAGYEGC